MYCTYTMYSYCKCKHCPVYTKKSYTVYCNICTVQIQCIATVNANIVLYVKKLA